MSHNTDKSDSTSLRDSIEDRADFNQLIQRLRQGVSGTAVSSGRSSDDEIWPLRLKTTSIDHFILGDVIGKGSYAEVRECIDTRSLERCAIKIVSKSYLKRKAPRALLNQLQEIRLLRHLKHRNIIDFKECLIHGSKIYIVLEHCTYLLHDLLTEQAGHKLSPTLSRYIFQQLCFGLDHLHSLGVVHRDIKPQNLLITNSGVVKIIDFGVSQILSMWSREDTCKNYEGSPLFQAPEVVCGQAEYSGYKVDIWSAGVTLYLMLFGQYPFNDESLLGLYDRILSEPLVFPEDVQLPCHNVVIDLIGLMLEKLASRRASIKSVLNHPWMKYKCSLMNGIGRNEFADSIAIQQSAMNESPNSSKDESNLGRLSDKFAKSTGPLIRDVYRSMTVLPYLHNHHFPHERLRRFSRASSRSSTPSRDSPQSSPSSSYLKSGQRQPIAGMSQTNVGAQNPHEIIGEDEVEWGTVEQYNLMKVPLIRANRIDYHNAQTEQAQRRARSQTRTR